MISWSTPPALVTPSFPKWLRNLLKCRADGHALTGRLHLRAELIGYGGEFIKGEAGELCDNVVKRGLEGRLCSRDLDLVEGHTYRDLCGNACDGIARCLGGERRASRNSGVYLYEVILRGIGVERELNVTAALYLKLLDELDRAVVEHLEVVVVEGHNGRNDERVTGMNANGVDVFHTAYGDRVVRAVTHNLKLDLLVALNALLNEHLIDGRCRKRTYRKGTKLVLVVGKAAARAAEGERGAQNYGVADVGGSLYGFLKGRGGL